MYLFQSSPGSAILQAVDIAIRQDLQNNRDTWFSWLLISAAVVVIGVVLEGPELGYETLNIARRRCLRKRLLRTPDWGKLVALLGWCLVVFGVAGEVVAERFTSMADGNLQTFNDILLADARKEAGNAKNSAEGAASAAQRAKVESAKAVSSASNALNLARDARGEADSVQQEIGKASGQLEQLEAETQKTKSDLTNLALCNAPRVISHWSLVNPAGAKSYVDPLRPMAGQIVFIEVVPDAEARRAALDIAKTLLDAEWKVQTPLRSVDGLSDGVSVQPSVPSFTASGKGEIPDMSPYWHASEVAEKLLDFLHSYNWQAGLGWPTEPQGKLIPDEKILTAGAIRIQVGLYPPAVYVSPPGQKELASAMDEIRLEREKTMAESKRKREEQLAALPPEVRKRLQQTEEEWDAKVKSETSNGPCQALNPNL